MLAALCLLFLGLLAAFWYRYVCPQVLTGIVRGPTEWPFPWRKVRLAVLPPDEFMYQICYYGDQPKVVIREPSLVPLVLKREADLVRRSDFGLSWILEEVLGKCLFVQHGNEWRRVVAVFKRSFTPKQVEKFFPLMTQESANWVKEMTNSPLRLTSSDLLRGPFIITCLTMYGEDIANTPDIDALIEFCDDMDSLTGHVFGFWGMASVLRRLPWSVPARVQSFRRRWEKWNSKKLAEVKKGAHSTGMLAEALAHGADTLSKEEVMHTLNEIVLANADFVAAAIAWPLVHLAQNPAALKSLEDELESVLHSRSLSSPTELRRMPYLDAVLKESWRLEPMMNVTNPVYLGSDVELVAGSPPLPKGTAVVFDTRALNRHPGAWEDPHAFKPERWLGEVATKINPHALHIFGLGSRKCLGQHYAILLCKIILVTLMGKFTIQPQAHLSAECLTEASYGPFSFPTHAVILHKRK